MTDDIDAIVRGSSKAQREWLTERARFVRNHPQQDLAWHCFPPIGTHRALISRGLVEYSGRLTPRGIAVRNRIMAQKGGDV